MEPKITIITINFNNAQGLEKTLKSVADQTYKNIQYVVVDGASTDGSRDVIEKFMKYIDIAIIEPDSGIYNAMNKGIKQASGDYLLFLNSGDWLLSDTVIEQVNSYRLDQDIVYGDMIFRNNQKEWAWNLPATLTFETFYTSTIPHPSSFIKRDLFNMVGLYDESLKIVSDWKFFILAVTKFNCSYKHIDCIISSYDFNGISSLPENLPAISAERNAVLLAEFPRMVKDYEELIRLKEKVSRNKFALKISDKFRRIFR